MQGKEQSPVDFGLAVMTSMEKHSQLLTNFHYLPGLYKAADTGKGLKWASDSPMGFFRLYNKDWDLKQFNIHAKSEHTIAGGQYDLEFQFVHTNKDGSMLVVGVLCQAEDFASSTFFDDLRASLAGIKTKKKNTMGEKKGAQEVELDLVKSVFQTIDTTRYFKYAGSLTTPPCTEGVQWVVFASELKVPKDFLIFLKGFKSMKYNFRPTQPVNDRNVETVEVAELLDDEIWRPTVMELIQFMSAFGILVIGFQVLWEHTCGKTDPMQYSLLRQHPV